MSDHVPARGDVDIDLARLSAALWARRVALVACVLVVGIAAYLMTSSIDPLYRAETRILIEEQEAPITRQTPGQDTRGAMLDVLAITSQVEVIRSSDLLRQVIDDLNLGSYPEFNPAAGGSSGLFGLFGGEDDPADGSSQSEIVGAVRDKLEVYQIENSRVIVIDFSSEDPELAAEVANALAAVYLEVQSAAKLASNAGATAWLEPEIADLTGRVREAEARVAAYRSQSNLFLVGENSTLSDQQLSDISTELSQVRAQRADAEARATNVRTALEEGRSTDAVSSVLQSSLIQRLRERQVAIQSEIADLSTTLLDNHPRIRGLRSQLANLDGQISNEVGKALGSLESDAAISRLREQELVNQLNELKSNSARAGEEEVELRALEREATAERELLEAYLARFREAVSRGDPDALPADARIISHAQAPSEPYYPKTMPVVVVAMLATGLIFAIVVMLTELFSGRALRATTATTAFSGRALAAPLAPADRTSRFESSAFDGSAMTGTSTQTQPSRFGALERDVDEPVVAQTDDDDVAAADNGLPPAAVAATHAGAVSEAEGEPELEEDFSPAAVAGALVARKSPIVAGLSPEGDRGSAGAVLLARALAESGRRALLIDMTGTGRPSTMMTDSAHLPGITDLLCGGVTIADAIHADRASSADIIPLGNGDPEMAMRGASRISMIIEALSDAYDVVIVECGQTGIDSVKRMLGAEVTVVLSIVDPDEDMVARELNSLMKAGHGDALLLLADDEEDFDSSDGGSDSSDTAA